MLLTRSVSRASEPSECTVPGRVGQTDGAHPITFEVHGSDGAPAVVVLGGISANRHVHPTPSDPSPGWWRGVVGIGAAVDPSRHRVIGIDYLPHPDEPCPDPQNTAGTANQADAIAEVLDTLGIRVATIVGASFGGMVAFHFAARHPNRVRQIIALGAAHRAHPMATALRSIQRRIVALGGSTGREKEALALARELAMTTYRSVREFEERFQTLPDPSDEGDHPHFPVESYLNARGKAFADQHSAVRFAALSESIDLHYVDPTTVNVPVSLLSFQDDAIAPPWLVQELHERLEGPSTHETLPTRYGHDAFLKEPRGVSDFIRRAERVVQ